MSNWYVGWHNNISSTAHEYQKILQSRSNTQVEADWTQQVKVTPAMPKCKLMTYHLAWYKFFLPSVSLSMYHL